MFCVSDHCRNLEFREIFEEKRLINHVIHIADVIEENVRRALCYMEPNCVSYNFKKSPSPAGDHKCELNNSTHEGHEHELKKNRDYKYHGAKVSK